MEWPLSVSLIASIQSLNPIDQGCHQSIISGHLFGRRIGTIAQQHKLQRWVRICQVMSLQTVDQFRDVTHSADKNRHDHGSRILRWNAIFEVQLWQKPRRNDERYDPIDDGHAKHRGGNRGDYDSEKPHWHACAISREIEGRENQRADTRNRQRDKVDSHRVSRSPTGPDDAGGRVAADLGFQLLAASPDQTMADHVLWFARRADARLGDHIRCYVRLASRRTASQFLDRLPVFIAGGEVQLWIEARGISPKDRFHSTGLVKEVLPRNGGQHSQIGDRTSDALGILQNSGSGSPRR